MADCLSTNGLSCLQVTTVQRTQAIFDLSPPPGAGSYGEFVHTAAACVLYAGLLAEHIGAAGCDWLARH